MNKNDVLKAMELDSEKQARQNLKVARHARLEQETGKAFPINGVNRTLDVKDALELGLPEDQVKSLMTKASVTKYEKITASGENL